MSPFEPGYVAVAGDSGPRSINDAAAARHPNSFPRRCTRTAQPYVGYGSGSIGIVWRTRRHRFATLENRMDAKLSFWHVKRRATTLLVVSQRDIGEWGQNLLC